MAPSLVSARQAVREDSTSAMIAAEHGERVVLTGFGRHVLVQEQAVVFCVVEQRLCRGAYADEVLSQLYIVLAEILRVPCDCFHTLCACACACARMWDNPRRERCEDPHVVPPHGVRHGDTVQAQRAAMDGGCGFGGHVEDAQCQEGRGGRGGRGGCSTLGQELDMLQLRIPPKPVHGGFDGARVRTVAAVTLITHSLHAVLGLVLVSGLGLVW